MVVVVKPGLSIWEAKTRGLLWVHSQTLFQKIMCGYKIFIMKREGVQFVRVVTTNQEGHSNWEECLNQVMLRKLLFLVLQEIKGDSDYNIKKIETK